MWRGLRGGRLWGGAYMDMWELTERACTRIFVSVRVHVYLYMCLSVFMCVYVWTVDRTTGGLSRAAAVGGQAVVVSVNLCPLPTPARDSSLTGITNMTPGHATLATVPELSSSISLKNREPLNTDYYIASRPIANMVWTQWTMVSGRVCLGTRECEEKGR